jgi:5-methylcytosine-specific restriction endonuclease McrA
VVPCSKCGLEREKGAECKPCKAERYQRWLKNNPGYHTKWQRDNKDRHYAAAKRWAQAHPDDVREWKRNAYHRRPEFHRQLGRDYAAANRDAARARATKWYAENKERAREAARRWHAENPGYGSRLRRKRRSAEGSFTRAEWDAIVKRQHGRCADCAIKPEKLTVDHIIPLAKGGCNYAFNIQALCARCNSRKNSKVAPGAQHTLFDKVAA